MVVIKEASAKAIFDSRKDKTILIEIKTSDGKKFSASAPNGKSKGKYEAKPYKKSLDEDIKKIKDFSDYFSNDIIENFDDLRRIEDIVEGHIGANTLFALESAALKALADEQKKEIWQLINPNAKKFPRFVGNCIGGGAHSEGERKPDFQEFVLIPDSKSPKENFELMKKAKSFAEDFLKKADEKFSSKKNDEDAWNTSLNDRNVLEIMKLLRIPNGIDIASSSFYKRGKYSYKDPMIKRDEEEQFGYLSNLLKNFEILYVEDPFHEEDFENFAKLMKKFPDILIIGDDLTVTNSKRLKKAIEKNSINSIIVKPNQCGSLLEVKKVCELAKKKNIKIVFSHRSGETEEDILADLAFGFEADFLKCGITGKVREAKIKRLIEIEKSLK